MRLITALIACCLGFALVTGSAYAAGFIKFDGVDGESAAGGEHEIEYDLAAGKLHGRYADITLKRGTMATALKRAFDTGGAMSNVEIAVEQNGRMKTVRFDRARVKSWSQSGDEIRATIEELPARAKVRPSESVSLNFEKP